MKLGIIGGGPAGIFSALEAQKRGASVTLFDNNEYIGRKLSVTGAGRCNLTNINVSANSYNSEETFAFEEILDQYNFNFLNQYFLNLGIFTYHTDDGWVYPISNSARNIASYLEDLLIYSGVHLKLNTRVLDITKSEEKFLLSTETGDVYEFEKVVLASGGKAYPQLNASDQILNRLARFGHKIIPSSPALAPLLTSKNETKFLNGVRTDALIGLKKDNEILDVTTGNIIFTDWGINGPGVMDLSYLVNKNLKNLTIELKFSNLFPVDFYRYVESHYSHYPYLISPLLSMMNKKLIDQFTRNLKLNGLKKFSFQEFSFLWHNLLLSENVTGTRGFEFSQISTGAVVSAEINPLTLESRLCPGLYFAGEVLDVMGPCGGYNLHWAFVSGYVAGKSALRQS